MCERVNTGTIAPKACKLTARGTENIMMIFNISLIVYEINYVRIGEWCAQFLRHYYPSVNTEVEMAVQ
jgi:hypothetical protein